MYNMICMLYLNKPEKMIEKVQVLEKRVNRARKAAYLTGYLFQLNQSHKSTLWFIVTSNV